MSQGNKFKFNASKHGSGATLSESEAEPSGYANAVEPKETTPEPTPEPTVLSLLLSLLLSLSLLLRDM